MNIWSWEDFLSCSCGEPVPGPVSLTIGVFDGVHRGHQSLIDEVTADEGQFPMVFTFGNSPMAILRPNTFLGPLSTKEIKLHRLEKFGLRGVVVIDFSDDFSKLTGEKFLGLIKERIDVRKLVLGSNHRFGRGGDVGPEEAEAYCAAQGIELKVVPSLRIRDHRVSSTRIRYALLGGEMELVRELLGSPYAVDLRNAAVMEEGENLFVKREEVNQILPPPGIYPVEISQRQVGFATEVTLDEDRMIWKKPADEPVEKIFF